MLLCHTKICRVIFYHVHITAHNIPCHILSRVILCHLTSHHVKSYHIYIIPYHITSHHIKHLIISLPYILTYVRYRSMTSGCTWVCQRMPSLPGWEAEPETCCRMSNAVCCTRCLRLCAAERLRLCAVHNC